MSEAAEILVIIVSSVLTLFLIVSIILGIYLIKLTVEIRRIVKSAEDTVDSIGSAAKGFSKLVSPVFAAEFINRLVKKYTNKGRK